MIVVAEDVAPAVGTLVAADPLEDAEPVVERVGQDVDIGVVPVDQSAIHRFHERPCGENLIIQNRDRELGLFLAERQWKVDVIHGPDDPVTMAEAGTENT